MSGKDKQINNCKLNKAGGAPKQTSPCPQIQRGQDVTYTTRSSLALLAREGPQHNPHLALKLKLKLKEGQGQRHTPGQSIHQWAPRQTLFGLKVI